MACTECRKRSALIAMLAPAIERAALTRQSLLSLLALSDERLCRAVRVQRPGAGTPLRHVEQVRVGRGSPEAASAICRHEEGYPVVLAQLECAPAVLYASGDAERVTELLEKPTVAIVGDRFHTRYARQIAFALGQDLALAGVTVVSGLDQGIDGMAHHGALHTGGRTVAVTGCAPEIPYPRQQGPLHREIVCGGAVVSEFPPGFYPPRRWCFVASQRIIGALARVVVVVEAAERSSVLLAVQIASDVGHSIAAVPGRVTDPSAQGTFRLLCDGAQPVAGAADVLQLVREEVGVRVAAV
jgi:DNA processing protein